METQYYTLVEKQTFYEIIENKYGELAIFINSRPGTPVDPVLEFDGKETALLRRDERLAIRLDNIDPETKNILGEREFVMIVELSGEVVERVYGVPVSNVESIFILGRQGKADEIIKARNKSEILASFGAVKSWTGGEK